MIKIIIAVSLVHKKQISEFLKAVGGKISIEACRRGDSFAIQMIRIVTIKKLRFIKKKLHFLFYSEGIIP